MGRALPASIALLATLPVLPAPASAYRTASDLVDYRQDHDPYPVRWRGRRLTLTLGPTDASGLPRAVVEAALDASVDAWRGAACGALTIDVVRSRPTRARTGDGRVTVEWRDDDWASAGLSAQAAGTTDVVYQQATSGDWEIVDADVHLNARHFTWSVDGDGEASGPRDVQAVLTHELGHVLGLLHPCDIGDDPEAPACDARPADAASTMSPIYSGLAQRTIGIDDAAGLCHLYGPSCDPGCGPGQRCLDGMCAHPCGGDVCQRDELCTPEGCTVAVCRDARGPAARCGGAELRDPCDTDEDCNTGFCSSDAHCSQPCGAQDWCPDGLQCAPGDTIRECLGAGDSFGAACSGDRSCASGLCIAGDAWAGMCTRACDAARRCPDDFVCTTLDDVAACRPPYAVADGCSVRPTAPRDLSGAALAALLLTAIVRRRQTTR